MTNLLITQHMKEKARVNKACCLVEMFCNHFIYLTTENAERWKVAEAAETYPLDQYNDWVRRGDCDTIPFLEVDIHTGKVRGHEGRHRALALLLAGHRKMTVAIYLKDGYSFTYHKWDHATDTKRYLTSADVPRVLIGQYAPVRLQLDNADFKEDLWAAWNKVSARLSTKATSIRIKANTQITVGFGWDKYTPKVEAGIVADCMRLQGITPHIPVQVAFDTGMSEAEVKLASSILERIGIQLVSGKTELSYVKLFLQAQDSQYYPDPDFVQQAKVARSYEHPAVKRIRLTQDDNRYPDLPTSERMAPPGTMPQYKARPPQAPSLMALPFWAWN